MNKYENALLQLAIVKKSLKLNNQSLSEALQESYSTANDALPKDELGLPIFDYVFEKEWITNKWLKIVYTPEVYYDGSASYFEEEEIRDFLSNNCMHALRAHDLIQERKELKKNLGVAKRRVTFLANQLLKNNTPVE